MDATNALASRGVTFLKWPTLAIFVSLAAAISLLGWCYSQGLTDFFLLDDTSNLEALANINGNPGWNSISAYLNTGVAGPVGRPLALLSFILNATDWPTSAVPFKYTNLFIHILNSLLVLWFSLLVLQRVKGRSTTTTVIAGLIASAWAFNPYHVSTVLYVVQRMAMLSSLFVLLGMVIYFKARIMLESREHAGYGLFLVLVAYATGVGLGVLSKENAALFVLMVPLIEWIFFSESKPPTTQVKHALSVVLVVPALLLLVGIAAQWPSFEDDYRWFRDFTLTERLLTQPRALGYYLIQYLVPGGTPIGIYGDAFRKSTGLLEPVSTSIWIFCHLLILCGAVMMRRRLPLLAFGVLFFYIAHLMESSIIPLALFFEHRNYLASAFLFLPLAAVTRVHLRLLVGGLAAFVLVHATLLKAEVSVWADPERYHITQVERNPGSEWATKELASWYMRTDRVKEGVEVIRAFDIGSSSLRMRITNAEYACYINDVRETDVQALTDSGEAFAGRPTGFLTDMDRLAALVGRQQCANLDLYTLQNVLQAHRTKLLQSPEGKQAYYFALSSVAFNANNYSLYKRSVLEAVRANPDAFYTVSACPALARVSREDSCACLRAGSAAFVGDRGIKRTLVRAVLGYGDQLRQQYRFLRYRLCGGD